MRRKKSIYLDREEEEEYKDKEWQANRLLMNFFSI
jgi:hypothetical protein